MRLRLPAAAAAACLALSAAPAFAGALNDVPSCYAAAHIQPADGRGYSRLFYVLIDQSVAWNRDMESSMAMLHFPYLTTRGMIDVPRESFHFGRVLWLLICKAG
jgi:hypothetical protein